LYAAGTTEGTSEEDLVDGAKECMRSFGPTQEHIK